MNQNNLLLKPGEKTLEFKEGLQKINKQKKENGFGTYRKKLAKYLHSEKKNLDENYKRFLGGFILGEASINLSLKKNPTTTYGVSLDPQFSVSGHFSGKSHLIALLDLFQTGRIYFKRESNATLVYVVDNRQSIQKKILPFWEKYIRPYQVCEENRRYIVFKKVLEGLERGEHRSRDAFTKKLLPLWDQLRKQKGQKNQSFENLQNAIDFVRKNSCI